MAERRTELAFYAEFEDRHVYVVLSHDSEGNLDLSIDGKHLSIDKKELFDLNNFINDVYQHFGI